jgi:mono/diheme cytochrome c family protein
MGWVVVAAVVVAGGPGIAAAQERSDQGRREYMANCAVCHGASGNGAGYYEGFLTRKPVDLTVLARNNGGVFPFQRVYEVIDGRRELAGHGQRDMPIWGNDYGAKGTDPFGMTDPEVFVRARIMALTEYVYRIQAK